MTSLRSHLPALLLLATGLVACQGRGTDEGPHAITVTVDPTSATVETGTTQTFNAAVQPSAARQEVRWSISPANCGSFVSTSATDATYQAPSAAATCTVTATSVQDGTRAASATVTVTAAPQVAITIDGAKPRSITTAQTADFSATVSNTSDAAVTWSVSPAGCGSIASTGTARATFTPPATPASCTVRATAHADTTKSDTVTVNVTAIQVTGVAITEASPHAMYACEAATFHATVSPAGASQSVTWAASAGTINASTGAFTAPGTPTTVTITATSVANTSARATLTVNVADERVVSVTLDKTSVSLAAGQTVQFHAQVTTTCGPQQPTTLAVTAPTY